MVSRDIPQSASFAFDVSSSALSEQLARIDSIDSKAGVLLAADGILAGLIFGGDSIVATAPPWLAILAGVGILLSFTASLGAFAARDYRLAPRPEEVAQLSGATEAWIRWNLIGNVLEAVETNRGTLRRKARYLAAGQLLLLVTLVPVGAYSVYASITGGA